MNAQNRGTAYVVLLIIVGLLSWALSGCSSIPIGPTGKGYFDQCITLEGEGINSVGQAGIWNFGWIKYSRNVDCPQAIDNAGTQIDKTVVFPVDENFTLPGWQSR